MRRRAWWYRNISFYERPCFEAMSRSFLFLSKFVYVQDNKINTVTTQYCQLNVSPLLCFFTLKGCLLYFGIERANADGKNMPDLSINDMPTVSHFKKSDHMDTDKWQSISITTYYYYSSARRVRLWHTIFVSLFLSQFSLIISRSGEGNGDVPSLLVNVCILFYKKHRECHDRFHSSVTDSRQSVLQA